MGATTKQLQDKLNMANKTVAELMKANDALKKESNNFERNFNNVNECYEGLYDSYEKLKADNALLEDSYTEVKKDYKDLLDKFTEISAENYALKSEIERTNRHINLAENALNGKEQQPLVVNHYHNCVINK
jgi:chromosome segregation ATPase